jgi:serine O-acetyltransferase
MKLREYRYLVYSDLYRITGRFSTGAFLSHLLLHECFKYAFWMRTCRFLHDRGILGKPALLTGKAILRHYRHKLGTNIPYRADISSGFYIGHFGGIVVNEDVMIGKNCNLMHGVTLAQANRGERKGCPIIGNNVFVGPGAVVVGQVKIGDNAVIGANSVVTTDVPDNAVVGGIPAKIISFAGSVGYINRTDY